MDNARFFAYYKAQRIIPDDAEWDEFVDALRRHLPTTFRVAGSRQTATTLNTLIRTTHVPALSNVTFEDAPVPPPEQLSWYPDGLAWQFNVPKKVLRRSPEFKKFHSFLVFETEVGNISRQEAVSMLPPLLLDVEPHHKCMDMCAAPGSKTAQILEALHANDTSTSTSIPPGLLIANDSDNKRTHLLIHQSARLPSPALMVTNLDASGYPNIKVPLGTNAGIAVPPTVSVPPAAAPKKLPGRRQKAQHDRLSGVETLLFDRILCDVPCSGDGTIRKNMGIWKTWAPMDGNGLHTLQLRILQRAMNMLKDNGRIVYSTCSLNPVENEAVVAAALIANKDFHLIPTAPLLPTLRRAPGLTTWRPTTDRTCARTFESYDEFMASDVDENVKAKMTRGHWPPEGVDVGVGVDGLNLERCMRIYPHLQDTGGFFVAVFEKKARENKSKASGSSSTTDRKRDIDTLETSSAAHDLPETKRARLDADSADSAAADAMVVDDSPVATEGPDADAIDVDADASTPARDAEEAQDANEKAENEGQDEEGDGEGEEEAEADEAEEETTIQPSGPTMMVGKKLARGEGGFKENPYTFLPPTDPILVSCLTRLHIPTTTFPTSNVLVRNPSGDAARSLYLANDIVKAVILNNSYEKMRLTAAGVKVFAKQEGGGAKSAAASTGASTSTGVSATTTTTTPEAQFRVLGEGLPVVLPYVDPAFIIDGDMKTLRTLVEAYYPLCASFEEPFRGVVEGRASGSHIVRFPLGQLDGVNLTHDLVLPIWKSNVSLTLMIDKKAKRFVLSYFILF
ncbi:S-adenosyl-L-methionine-dependent methyltransferase [Pholiota conissans]|uniref:S-adenosyl-L-methionine-dependent methyltransferase n=1 Tax=Pholiota conissans TaxID=109636 RepID=A0A9P5YQ00_9AGAR|nr:S-adenosyl-L-methionine-dependent methyltransferase [Pholiota conissans]